MNIWIVIFRIAWIVSILVLIGVLGALFSPPVRQFKELEKKQARLEQDIRFQEERIRHIKDKQDRLLNDPRFVEKIAREELGMAKPGETVYKRADDEADAGAPAPHR